MSERLKIRAVPNAPKSHCAGAYGDGVKIKIAAPAMDGKANAELIKYLAKTLGISKSGVRILSGESYRDKIVEVSGIEGAKALLLAISEK